jgi:hypothetical protein
VFSSFYEWPLSATALAGLLLPVWRIAQNRKSAFRRGTYRAPDLSTPLLHLHDPVGIPIRGSRFRWISTRDFPTLFARFSDLILIDLRDGDQWSPIPVHTQVFAIRVKKYELAQVLEQLAVNKVIVFFGATDFAALIIEASPIVKGSAPIFFMEGEVEKEAVA